MDINEFKASLKNHTLGGIYILGGEEDYLIRYYLTAIRNSLGIDDSLGVFNNPAYDGDEVDFSCILEAIKSPPMMSDFKLVEWRHADFSIMNDGELDNLETLAEEISDYPYSIVVFTAKDGGVDFGTAKRPSAFIKRFGSKIHILEFPKSSESQLYVWLKKHFAAQGVTPQNGTVEALVFRSGHSMDVLANEVTKLASMVLMRGRNTVTPDDVNEIASSTPECDTFALSNAILERNKEKAYMALEEMKVRRVDAVVVMGMLSKVYGELCSVALLLSEGLNLEKINKKLNMNEYKLKKYIAGAKNYSADRLSEIVNSLALADAGSKYGGIPGYTAIELFVSQNL